MSITHSLNGHPNTGRQDEIILKGEKMGQILRKQPFIVLFGRFATFYDLSKHNKLTGKNDIRDVGSTTGRFLTF